MSRQVAHRGVCSTRSISHLGDSQENLARSDEVTKSRRDEVSIGQLDSQRTVDVEGCSCVDKTCSSIVVLSVRHITVGVQSVRHITGSTYKRATHHVRGRRTRNERSRKSIGASVTFQWRTWSETTT